VGPGEIVVVDEDAGNFSWNPELGVVIGKGGKDIPVDEAMSHVAGLTVVLDMVSRYYHDLFEKKSSNPPDWYADATASWLGKKSDTFCPMGPYVTTLDEIGSPYDLLIYTRQSGWLRDRSHTNSMLVGIERLVSWLSSFMTLYPGDVLHMATMGVDGMRILPAMSFGPDDYVEGEIEGVGVLRVPVVKAVQNDWRAPDSPSRAVHPSPAVRDLISRGETAIASPQHWSLKLVRHFFTVYGNYTDAEKTEGMPPCRWPRILNGPPSALSASGADIHLPKRAGKLDLGPELAFVVGRMAKKVPEEEAEAYILGYLAMASILDRSFEDPVREPATLQERHMPGVYGRWGDGYNAVSAIPVPLSGEEVRGRRMQLSVENVGEVTHSTDAYLLSASRILAFVSGEITLFPGDVVTFGRVGDLLTIPADRRLPAGAKLCVMIEGIGDVSVSLIDDRNSARN
jgi:2-keto-4-pentenoate hydratase/2-oxohepta-3-ene-1,7-dioic acid hydratase in catechol pathway